MTPIVLPICVHLGMDPIALGANNDHKYIHWNDNASDGCKFVRGKQYIRSFDRINFEKYSPSVFGIDLYAFPFHLLPGDTNVSS